MKLDIIIQRLSRERAKLDGIIASLEQHQFQGSTIQKLSRERAKLDGIIASFAVPKSKLNS